jgi:anti-sigma regulatory factor (Ser/Thr protein kinase)
MPLVGTQALGAARMPGAAVVPPVGDLATAVRPCVRALVRALARIVVVGLRACRHGVAGVVVALRVRSVLPLAGATQAAAVPSPQVGAQAVPTRRNEVALPADPTAPRRARALLRAATEDWGLDDDLYQDAAMVVTELVANAVDHAGTGSTLTVDLDDRGLRVAVRDGRPDCAPRPRPVDPTAPRGRGLQMIDALTASWGVVMHADGKTVWAVLPQP